MTALLQSAAWRDGTRAKLTKTITPTEVRAFDDVKTFDLTNFEPTSFSELVVALTEIEREPTMALIRGSAITEGPSQPRLLRDQPDGRRATIRPVAGGLQWIMLDVDKAPAPADLAPTNEARLEYLRDYLPPVFRNASTYFQWSSSAGLDGWQLLSAHFFFWLDRPHLCADLHRRSLRGDWKGLVDPAPFSPNQIHYTAAPVFTDGAVDPVAERSGVIVGEVEAVALEPWIEPYRPRPVYSARTLEAMRPGSTFAAAVREIGRPHYHLPLLSAIARYVAVTPTLARDKFACLTEIEQACADSGRSYITANYLSRVYDDAERKFGK